MLAAFGAVVGKQRLYSFEAARKRGGSLEESGTRRQMKLNKLERLQLFSCLQAFLWFLQVALLLFSVSLCLKTWTNPLPTFVVMVCTAASVALFCAGSIFLAMWQDSPPTSGSHILNRVFPIRWILETPMNQEAAEAAAAMVPLTQWLPNLNVSTAFERLLDNFEAYRNSEELYVKFGKAMAHFCIQPVQIDDALVDKRFWSDEFQATRSRFIRDAFTTCRDAFMTCRDAYCHNKTLPLEEDMTTLKLKYRASVRTALRTMVVHGLDFRFSLPDNETLIWNGDLRWSYIDGCKPD
ncbi:hypothetical protein F4604DRAFT_1677709 [Suillus subluteus]|nr:hypothetical protein F4604DRAFT_1677709 [Suillus subluteus]